MLTIINRRLVVGALLFGLLGFIQENSLAAQGGARPTAMGGAFVALADDAHASTWNPAGLAWQKDQEVAVSGIITGRKDYIPGDAISDDYLAYTQELSLINQSLSGTAAVFYQNCTYENAITRSKTILMQPGIAYGHQLGSDENMSWGISLNYYNFESQIPGLSSSDTAISLNAGFLWYFTDKAAFGLTMENMNEPTFTIHGVNSRLLRVWRPGLAYYIDDATVCTFDVYDATGNTKDSGSDYSQNVSVGLEHYFNQDVSLRLGGHNLNSTEDSSKYYSLGIGWQRADFIYSHPVCYYVDYTFIYWQNPVVGNDDYLHQVGLSCKF